MPRTISIGIDHPGWGLPTAALLEFVERWVFSSGGTWELTKYAYELRAVPGPSRLASIGTMASTTRIASIRTTQLARITTKVAQPTYSPRTRPSAACWHPAARSAARA